MRQPALLLIDDDSEILNLQAKLLRDAGCLPFETRSLRAARDVLSKEFVDLLIVDERIGAESGVVFLEEQRRLGTGIPGIVVTGHADLSFAVRAMRAGALDLIEKPYDPGVLTAAVTKVLSDLAVLREARYYRWRASRGAGFGGLVGTSPAFLAAVRQARRYASARGPILLLGESGTGKDLFARAIHEESPYRGGPCVIVNAAAISPSLAESTIFGHVRGAFTGADRDRQGVFEQASGGTLFLDEIAEMPLELQAKLLRVLEEGSVMPLGGGRSVPVDVRVVCATNRDLREEARAGRFREDLMYRVGALTVSLPALRERGTDVEILAQHFLARHAEENHLPVTGFSAAAANILRSYGWPGNIRQLNNAVRAAVLNADSLIIEPSHFPNLGPKHTSISQTDGDIRSFREAQSAFEQHYFSSILDRTAGNKAEAARLAGLDRSSLYEHLAKLKKLV